jgi:hypothetical protein
MVRPFGIGVEQQNGVVVNLANPILTKYRQRQRMPIVWLVISLLAFTACLGGGGNEAVATGADSLLLAGTPGTVVCTAACSQRAQCGSRMDGQGEVVLAGSGGPLVATHELFFPNNTAVQIGGQVVRTLQPTNASEPFTMNFYFVTATDGSNKGGWVAGWCVQAAVTTP